MKSLILVQKPYMERRTYAAFMKNWEGTPPEVYVTSPQLSMEEYANEEINFDTMLNVAVGDLQV